MTMGCGRVCGLPCCVVAEGGMLMKCSARSMKVRNSSPRPSRKKSFMS